MGSCGSTKTDNKVKSQNKKLDFDETAVLKLKQCRDEIKGYVRRLNDQESKAKDKTKNLLKSGNRERAKLSLNLSKMYKLQADNANDRLYAVEEQINQIEATKNQNQVFKALKEGNEVLKKLQEEVKIEDLEKISEDMEENRDRQREINDFFQQYGVDVVENDKQIEDELENMMKMQAKEAEAQLPEVSNLKKEKIDENDENQQEKASNKKEAMVN